MVCARSSLYSGFSKCAGSANMPVGGSASITASVTAMPAAATRGTVRRPTVIRYASTSHRKGDRVRKSLQSFVS